jgi:hypothetical protein
MAAMDSAKQVGRPSPRGWLGIGIRLLTTLFFLLLLVALSRCSPSAIPTTNGPTATVPTVEAGTVQLRVEVRPEGARVIVDGLRSGSTPVTIDLPPGQHTVRVEMEGYEPLEQTSTLAPGDKVIVDGELRPLAIDVEPTRTRTPTPGPTPGAEDQGPLPDLAIKYVKIELETGGDCDYTSTQLGLRVVIENTGDAGAGPFVVEANGAQQTVDEGLAAGETARLWFAGYKHGGENTVIVDTAFQVQESDEDNNSFSQLVPIPTLPPTCTPPPTEPATATPAPPPTTAPVPPAAVTLHEGQITIPTYPYADHTVEAWNETFHMSYRILDREAYEASNPVPAEVAYRTLEVENEYLKLTFLPDVGGRLYEVFYKPTGHRVTYRNPVLKPSPWGPPEQGWWLAAGGIEWCLPVEEHGYEWGEPWRISASQDAQSVTVILRDTPADTQDRVRAIVAVRLEAGASFFTIQSRLENPTGRPIDLKYWTNALLAPGGQNAPSADLRFVLPDDVTAVTVHSRGDEGLPDYGERLSWPEFDGVDVSRLGSWNRWLGFFVEPPAEEAAKGESFMAVYDEAYDEGMVRIFPAAVAPGAKGFAFGWADPIPAYNWTDDGSSYVEMHGGPAPTFDDSVALPAGGHLEWTETWYPVAGMGGLRYANAAGALNLEAGGGQAIAAIAVTRPWSGDLVLMLDGQERWRQQVSLVPGQPFRQAVPLGQNTPARGQLALHLQASGETIVVEYSADFDLK